MDKLYKRCVRNYSFGGFNFSVTGETCGEIPGFSAAQFLQSAQTTAAQARALSQQLSQYANQVEQNARALVP